MALTTYLTVNGTIYSQKKNGVRTHFIHDALGSVAATVNDGGSVVNKYTYKPFGEILSKTGVGEDPRFLWVGGAGYRTTGRRWAEKYVRRRHYGEQQGMWTTVDPLWPIESAYGYVRGSPILIIDVTGFQNKSTQKPKAKLPTFGMGDLRAREADPFSGTRFVIPSLLAERYCFFGGGNKCCLHYEWRMIADEIPFADVTWCKNETDDCRNCAKAKRFRSVLDWCRGIKDWWQRMPSFSLGDLNCIRNNYGDAVQFGFENCPLKGPTFDACRHCMASCYLTQRCGLQAARFSGWCREMRGITSCSGDALPSRAEWSDMSANQDGMVIGKNCFDLCGKYKAARGAGKKGTLQ